MTAFLAIRVSASYEAHLSELGYPLAAGREREQSAQSGNSVASPIVPWTIT